MSQFNYSAPDTREVASRILIAQMKHLARDDSYRSFTNILFYDGGQMREFTGALEEACEKGVHTRRIFNVANFELDETLNTPKNFRAAKNIISKHKELADKHKKSYEVGFFGKAINDANLIRTGFNPSDDPHLVNLLSSYFGVFCLASIKSTVLLVAGGKQVSSVTLSYCESTNPSIDMFDELWELCEHAPNPFAGDEFKKDWLTGYCDTLKTDRR